MIAVVPASPGTIKAAWTCPCGRERTLSVMGLNPALPLATGWRDAGACRACGVHATYRATLVGRNLRVEVTHGDMVE